MSSIDLNILITSIQKCISIWNVASENDRNKTK